MTKGQLKWISLGILVVLIAAVRYWYMRPSQENGDFAPDFTVMHVGTGDTLSLYQVPSPIILLDFWGSWCGPCLQQLPVLKELYSLYHSRGFEIVSIAIEKDPQKGRAAIDKFEIPWPYHTIDQSSNLRFMSGAVIDRYGVNQVPTLFLLDSERRILSVNPSWADLKEQLEEHL